MENKYIPVSCSLYDQLELLAMRKTDSEVFYLGEKGNELNHKGKVVDVFSAKDRIEYLVFEDGLKIRLDRLKILNGESYAPNC